MILLFLLFCLPTILVLLPAFTNFIWKLTVLITEYSHFYIILIIGTLFFYHDSQFSIAILIAFLAVALLASIHYRAFLISNTLENSLNDAFSYNYQSQNRAYSIPKLFYNTVKLQSPITITYDEINELKLQLYQNKSTKRQPCVIVVHGGAWDSGNYEQLPELNTILANENITVAAINYRLAPNYKFPAPIEDLTKAVAFLKTNSKNFNINPDNIFLLGRSAGGQISLCTGCILGKEAIKGIIAYYTPADLVWGYAAPGNPWILDSRKVLENYLGGTYNEVPENYTNATASNIVSYNTPPVLMIHGKRDEMVAYDHNTRLIKHLKKWEIPHFLVTLPWATHGGDYNILGPMGQISSFATLHFIKGLCNKQN